MRNDHFAKNSASKNTRIGMIGKSKWHHIQMYTVLCVRHIQNCHQVSWESQVPIISCVHNALSPNHTLILSDLTRNREGLYTRRLAWKLLQVYYQLIAVTVIIFPLHSQRLSCWEFQRWVLQSDRVVSPSSEWQSTATVLHRDSGHCRLCIDTHAHTWTCIIQTVLITSTSESKIYCICICTCTCRIGCTHRGI